MVTLVGGNAKLIEPDELTNQDVMDAIIASGIRTVKEGMEALPDPPASSVPKISHSLERLSHFRCSVCNGWWSISDWHVRAKGRTTLCCPWCGIEQEVAA